MFNYFVTGGAGFIGSNLCDFLLSKGHKVTSFDNYSTGNKRFLDLAKEFKNFTDIRGDILDFDNLVESMSGHDFIIHLAANADVRFGTQDTSRDLNANTIGTYNVLEAMRLNDIKNIAFSSTGSVYGDQEIIPITEDCSFPIQTSFYGASKLAGESLIEAFVTGFDFKALIFRFVSILGQRYSHGHVFDFYKKLKNDSSRLEILGNGKQKKSYLHVHDCCEAIYAAIENGTDSIDIYNLGTNEYVEVLESAKVISNYLSLTPKIIVQKGERGWIGDNPFIFLDTKKINSVGWAPSHSIESGILKTLIWLEENEWIFNERD